jgi:cell division protein FtsB
MGLKSLYLNGRVTVRNLLIASAIAAVLYLPVGAQAAAPASSNDLAQIREQLQSLIQRVDKLEQENTSLKSENETLKAQDEKLESQGEYLKAEAKGLRKDSATLAADAAKVKGADWAGRVTLKGDLRYRYEMISDDATTAAGIRTADRYRDRIRARFNADVKATDNILLGFGFTTTEGGDPRSGNQTLTGTFNRKSLDLDLAFFDWKFASWGDLVGGKMKQPFFKTSQSAFWDNDVNPEGLAFVYNSGIFFGSLYNFWLNEVSGAENTLTADTSVAGVQIGTKLPIGGTVLTLAAHYYDLSAARFRSPFYVAPGATLGAGQANGNTTCTVALCGVAAPTLAFDYEIIDVTAELNLNVGAYPLLFWADAAQNRAVDDLDSAWAAGVLFGKASNPKTWELGASYQVIEKDALFGQFIDSDFGGGTTDAQGYKLVAGFAPTRNWTLNATYFINDRNKDVANAAGKKEVGYDRAQLDFNVKF